MTFTDQLGQFELLAVLQSASGTDRPGAARQHLRLTLPSQVDPRSQPGDVPRDGSLAAMLAAFWEGKAIASPCSTIGAATLQPPFTCHCWTLLATAATSSRGLNT